jgi:hypothetical protein
VGQFSGEEDPGARQAAESTGFCPPRILNVHARPIVFRLVTRIVSLVPGTSRFPASSAARLTPPPILRAQRLAVHFSDLNPQPLPRQLTVTTAVAGTLVTISRATVA